MEDCLFNQQYCTFDYANFQANVGSQILRHQLIQYNIWRNYGVEKWFEYMNEFDDYCEQDWYTVNACSSKIKYKLNVTGEQLYNDDKDVMDLWKSKERLGAFDGVPEISVNNLIYRGNFDAADVFEMVCSSLETPPKECLDHTKIVDPKKNKGFKIWQIILICIGITFVLILGACVYRKFIKKEITNDMSSKVS